MLDSRVETFLAVCKNKSYTKAAKELWITQPAVTQHIQFLEKKYDCKLLVYANKELKLTTAGKIFYEYVRNAMANEKIIDRRLRETKNEKKSLKFGATRTIGEFTLSPVMKDFLESFSEFNVTMYVDNTRKMLGKLLKGEINFALVEGLFNKADYENGLLKKADYTLIGSLDHPLANKDDVFLQELKNETVIVREKGSGTRKVLETALMERNYTLKNFRNIIEIGNVNSIKNIVNSGIGISFIYKDAVRKELKENELTEITVKDFQIQREFNFVYLKNKIIEDEIDMFYSFFKKHI